MTRAFLAVALSFFVLSCGADVPGVSVQDLKARYDAGNPLVIDVRTAAELDGSLGRLDGARNIPLQLLPGRIEALRDDTVFLVCRTGNRSAQAVAMLRSHGVVALNVEGGMTAWRAAFGDRNR